MRTFLLLAALTLLLAVGASAARRRHSIAISTQAVNDDRCMPHPTCEVCLDNAFCGWCSSNVIYNDGTVGRQCAGFNPNSTDRPFVCHGTYQTQMCLPPNSYGCDPVTYQCVPVAPGQGQTIEDCQKECFAPVYECNQETGECEEVRPGQGTSLPICEAICGLPSTTGTSSSSSSSSSSSTSSTTGEPPAPTFVCDPVALECVEADPGQGTSLPVCEESCGNPIPGTPADLIGVWRGLQIDEEFLEGEFDALISESGIRVMDPNLNEILVGSLATMGEELWIYIEGPVNQGKLIRALWEIRNTPETRAITLAMSAPDGPVPPSFTDAMYGDEGMTVYVAYSCLVDDVCAFSFPEAVAAIAKRQEFPPDTCMVHETCEDCLNQRFCGWCSTNVIYEDGSEGTQCAGFNNDTSNRPFVCHGTYSTEECVDPSPAPPDPALTYICNTTTLECDQALPGQGTSFPVCDETCGKEPPSNPGVPPVLQGIWRGLEINNDYEWGEYRVEFDTNNVTFTNPQGETLEGAVSTAGPLLNINFQNGQEVKTLWQIGEGVETVFLSWAWGAPNGPAPSSFRETMTGRPMVTFEFISCHNPEFCNFAKRN